MAVIAGAVGVVLSLDAIGPIRPREEMMAVVVLCALALVAEMLMVMLPKGAHASISSMPALAAVLVSPTWQAVAAIAVVKALVESIRRVDFEKAVFNIAQFALSFGLAAYVFTRYGGTPFLEVRSLSLSALTATNGLPAFGAILTMFACNSLLVSGAIAISSRSSLSAVWRANNIATIAMELVASPLIFLFAWVYVQFGPIAAVGLWVPILGIRQVQKANIELERTNVELLDLMVKSIEARDNYTSGHSRRVQHYSLQIARALGLPERDIEMVGRAALLHDVGKIYEKYGPILQKADRLTPEEWNTMRQHPIDGAELVATMTKLRELVGSVRHHHENFDGTGYPDGIAGEVIPLPARIIRFADTIDAMTTERPYRPALQPEAVRSEIMRHRGSQFDPQIVDRLLSSPTWRAMLEPVSADGTRFGDIAVLAGGSKRSGKAQIAS